MKDARVLFYDGGNTSRLELLVGDKVTVDMEDFLTSLEVDQYGVTHEVKLDDVGDICIEIRARNRHSYNVWYIKNDIGNYTAKYEYMDLLATQECLIAKIKDMMKYIRELVNLHKSEGTIKVIEL